MAASYEARKYRRALGHAVGHRQAPLPRADLRQAAVRRLSRSLAADPRDLPRLHRPGRAAQPRRSLSRRHRGPARPRQRARHRRGHPPPHPRGVPADRLGRRLLLQVHRQARLRPPQARRPVRHHAREGRGVRRLAAGRALPRRRAGHRAQDGAAGHPHRRRPARVEPCLRCRRISAARPTGTGASAAASTSARSSPTGRTSRSAPSARSTRICAIPSGLPPSWRGSPAMPGTGSSAPRSRAAPSR